MANKTDYMGDGVYAEYDGSGIMLSASERLDPEDTIYLKPIVLFALIDFVKCVGILKED